MLRALCVGALIWAASFQYGHAAAANPSSQLVIPRVQDVPANRVEYSYDRRKLTPLSEDAGKVPLNSLASQLRSVASVAEAVDTV